VVGLASSSFAGQAGRRNGRQAGLRMIMRQMTAARQFPFVRILIISLLGVFDLGIVLLFFGLFSAFVTAFPYTVQLFWGKEACLPLIIGRSTLAFLFGMMSLCFQVFIFLLCPFWLCTWGVGCMWEEYDTMTWGTYGVLLSGRWLTFMYVVYTSSSCFDFLFFFFLQQLCWFQPLIVFS
jgi:hypothetical protein